MRKAFLVAGVLAVGLPAAVRADFLENPSFEQREGEKPVGWRNSSGFVCRHGEGLNGSGGLVWEGVAEKRPVSILQDVKGWRPGVSYRLSAQVRLQGFVKAPGELWGLRLWVEWHGKDDKWLGAVEARTTANGDLDWTTIECVTPQLPAATTRVSVMPYLSKGSKGKVALDNLVLTVLARDPVAFVTSDAYRDVASEGTVGFHAAFYPLPDEVAKHDFSAFFSWTDSRGRRRRTEARNVTARGGSVSLAAADLAEGPSDVVCELFSAGRLLGAATNRFTRVRELPKRKVTIDRHGRCLVDGQPFFPLGMYWYGNMGSDEEIRTFAASPFNCAAPYRFMSRQDLDRLGAAGLKVIADLRDVYPGSGTVRARKIENTWAGTEKWLADNVFSLRDHPSLLAWYITDEAPATEIPSLRRVYAQARTADPDHPTWAVLATLSGLREFTTAFDVLGVDPYPVPKRTLEHVCNLSSGAVRETFGARAFWHVPQAFSWNDSPSARYPTYEELLNMNFQHLACGANGLVAYIYDKHYFKDGPAERNPDWRTACRAAAEVKRLVPVLLSVDPAPGVREDADLPCRAWAKDGFLHVLVCNPAPAATNAVVRIGGGDWEFDRVEVGVGGTVRGGRTLEVALPPIGVSFVRLRPAPPPSVRFGVFTDTHIRHLKNGSWPRVEKAFETFRREKVDAIVHCGDLADYHLVGAYSNYHDLVVSTFPDPAKRPQLLYVYANHDVLSPDALFGKGGSGTRQMDHAACFAEMSAILGSPMELFQDRRIGGFRFLVFPEDRHIGGDKDFLEKRVAAACAEEKGKPVFVFVHVPPRDTVYDSQSQDPALRKALDRFPNVILFSGHIHNSLRNENGIWQGTFTAVDAGCLQDWYGTCLGTSICGKNAHDVLIVDARPDRVDIRRVDPRTGEELKPFERWSVPLPFDAKTAPYAPARAAARERPAAFVAERQIAVRTDKVPFDEVTVGFPSAEPEDDVFKYLVTVSRKDAKGGWESFYSAEMFGAFYEGRADRTGWQTRTLSAGYFTSGARYRFEVRPMGFHGTLGKPLMTEWTAPEKVAYETVWSTDDPARDCPFKVCSWWIRMKGGLRAEKKEWPHDAAGWFDLKGDGRLLFPDSVWKGPKGTRFRFVAEYDVEQPTDRDGYTFHLISNKHVQGPLIGWSGTPRGKAGPVVYVNDFAANEDDDDPSLALMHGTTCRIRFRRIAIEKKKE